MKNKSDINLNEALKLASDLTSLANMGEAECQDDGCAVVYGIIRDCAYKIKGRAERELQVHKDMQHCSGQSLTA